MLTGEWIGLREANRALKRLPDYVKPEVQAAMNVTAFEVAEGAKRRVRRRSGRLADAITMAPRPRSLSAVAGVSEPSETYYWKFLEYGTVKMAARPFWRPAAEAQAPEHEQRLMDVLRKAYAGMERLG